ncbi:hypothetical protein ABGB12_32270 [Actinocorallia sp. B10E7]
MPRGHHHRQIIDAWTGRLVTTRRLTATTGHFVNDIIPLGDRAALLHF